MKKRLLRQRTRPGVSNRSRELVDRAVVAISTMLIRYRVDLSTVITPQDLIVQGDDAVICPPDLDWILALCHGDFGDFAMRDRSVLV